MYTGKDCILVFIFALAAASAKSENLCRAKIFVFQNINVCHVHVENS